MIVNWHEIFFYIAVKKLSKAFFKTLRYHTELYRYTLFLIFKNRSPLIFHQLCIMQSKSEKHMTSNYSTQAKNWNCYKNTNSFHKMLQNKQKICTDILHLYLLQMRFWIFAEIVKQWKTIATQITTKKWWKDFVSIIFETLLSICVELLFISIKIQMFNVQNTKSIGLIWFQMILLDAHGFHVHGTIILWKLLELFSNNVLPQKAAKNSEYSFVVEVDRIIYGWVITF